MSNDWQALCLDKMKKIIMKHGGQAGLANLTDDQINEVYKRIAGDEIRIGGAGARKIKSLLCNLDNLRPDFKSRIEPLLFEKWLKLYQENVADSTLSQEKAAEPVSFVPESEPKFEENAPPGPDPEKEQPFAEEKTPVAVEVEQVPEAVEGPEEKMPAIAEAEPEEKEAPFAAELEKKAPSQEKTPAAVEVEQVSEALETPEHEPAPGTVVEKEKPFEKATVRKPKEDKPPQKQEKAVPAQDDHARKSAKPSIVMPIVFKRRKEDLFDKFLNLVARLMSRFVR